MRLVVLGLGYAGSAVAERVRAGGGVVTGTRREGAGLRLAAAGPAIAAATHILSTIPPEETGDPVLALHGPALARSGGWLGYLSSTGVYGDCGGAWVDESAPIRGRRHARNAADAAWLALGARVFRLPGIYGPGRSPLDRVAEGRAHRVGMTDQVFSRIHLDDLARGVVAGFEAPPGAYNLADDAPCDQDAVAGFAAALLGLPPPPLVPLERLSPASRAFYAENRRVANGRAKRVLGWAPRYPDYRAGLRALKAMTSPAPVMAPPRIASGDQR